MTTPSPELVAHIESETQKLTDAMTDLCAGTNVAIVVGALWRMHQIAVDALGPGMLRTNSIQHLRNLADHLDSYQPGKSSLQHHH